MCLGFFDKKRVFQWNWWLIGWRPNTNVKVHELGWSGSRGVVPYITLTLVGGVPPQQIQGAPAANPIYNPENSQVLTLLILLLKC